MRDKAVIFDLDMTLVDSSAAERLRSDRKWHDVYKKIGEFKVYDGIPVLLDFLDRYEIRYCVVTSSPRHYCELVLDHFDIHPEFSICYHDTVRHKPDPEPLRKAVAKLGLEPKNIIAIGDSLDDINAAEAAGLNPRLATWGFKDRAPDKYDRLLSVPTTFLGPKSFLQHLSDWFDLRKPQSTAVEFLPNGVGDFLPILSFDPRQLDNATSLTCILTLGYRFKDYEDGWTRLVNDFKFGNSTSHKDARATCSRLLLHVTSFLTRFFFSEPATPFEIEETLIVPILGHADLENNDKSPISALSKQISSIPGNRFCPNLLYKTKSHHPLHRTNRKEDRRGQMKGIYRSHKFETRGYAKPERVILIDDIVTTGTTMDAAAKAIQEINGAIPVYGLALAKAETSKWYKPPLANTSAIRMLKLLERELLPEAVQPRALQRSAIDSISINKSFFITDDDIPS